MNLLSSFFLYNFKLYCFETRGDLIGFPVFRLDNTARVSVQAKAAGEIDLFFNSNLDREVKRRVVMKLREASPVRHFSGSNNSGLFGLNLVQV